MNRLDARMIGYLGGRPVYQAPALYPPVRVRQRYRGGDQARPSLVPSPATYGALQRWTVRRGRVELPGGDDAAAH